MSRRPRIRSLKPELWSDAKMGHISREARLLFVGLITLADDEGRFLARPATVLGHVFPFDDDAPRKLRKWFDELSVVSLIVLYEHAGQPYGWLPTFCLNQRISHPKPSALPHPPAEEVRT